MTRVSRTFTVTAAPAPALRYLADFSNAETWDPGTVRCTRLDEGPVRVGSQWHNETKIAGVGTQLTYTLEEWTADRVVLVGHNDTATSTETIVARPDPRGAELTYTNEVEMRGMAKLASPAIKLVFEKIGADLERQLTEALDVLPGDGD
ncbi:Polyketide cyclase / dehydrase and lipid transport [Rhodococcus sp. RD6.2]|uniref:SRPBCC family protein n=1 Tax=Rhodococcus sp. RD6.2 TaxID=260936 RepID=UPI00063B5660|nr:SRPBCC family protein [Rhodococcus sp. RD6.2]CRK53452.1 Polyketide cyclase / dehydrase and lipid transport [Rhodococcus sp. RD6.2]